MSSEPAVLTDECQKLVGVIRGYDDAFDEERLLEACRFSRNAHKRQKRASGEPYFSHPLAVAEILAGLKMDTATVITGLLHDAIEDTNTTRVEIEKLFGADVGALVDGVTKIHRLDLVSKKTEQAENFRKLLIAISSDVRVLLVKLADRLHNMRTLEYVGPEKRQRISTETMDIYAPLAGRMGFQWMREELEGLAFKWLHPQAHETITAKLVRLREENKGFIAEIEEELRELIAKNGIKAKVTSREKKPYSIWNKTNRKQTSMKKMADLHAFRIITETIEDCYRVMGLIHTKWNIVPGRFKDHISVPKSNGYSSIHTTVVGPKRQRVELQIRTEEMHQIAEYGVAAHTVYKEEFKSGKLKGDVTTDSAYQWLRSLVDNLMQSDNSEELMENTRMELFKDQVFCFTPRGRMITLPYDATPIDFAYKVHTDIGNTCIGCKINGHITPLTSKLKNGDEVEIICSDEQKMPPLAWENIVVTGKARSSIALATRAAKREQYSQLGREIMEYALSVVGRKYSGSMIEKILPKLAHDDVEDVLAAIGRGELASRDVLKAIDPALETRPAASRRSKLVRSKKELGWFGLGSGMGLKFKHLGSRGGRSAAGKAIPIRGVANMSVKFAPEGGAIPGDRVIGIITPGEGITIYPTFSSKLEDYSDHPDRWIDVAWDIDEDNHDRFTTQIVVTAINAPGTLAKIADIIGSMEGNIDKLVMLSRAHDFTEMLLDLEVWDTGHLRDILSSLRKQKVVSKAERYYV
jgi:RelA/SpoT family (p)ppGpp synthetase